MTALLPAGSAHSPLAQLSQGELPATLRRMLEAAAPSVRSAAALALAKMQGARVDIPAAEEEQAQVAKATTDLLVQSSDPAVRSRAVRPSHAAAASCRH